MQTPAQNRKKTLFIAQFSILLAIEAIVCFTPLGSIPFTPAIVATLMMIPVVITAILLGTLAGASMGFFAGLFSFLVWTFVPPNPLLAFLYTPFYSLGEVSGNFGSLLICFVPRILAGAFAGLCFNGMKKLCPKGKDALVYGLSGCICSLTNTVLVLAGTYFIFGRQVAETLGIAYQAMMGLIGSIILTNGLPEAVIATVTAYAICKPIRHMLSSRQ